MISKLMKPSRLLACLLSLNAIVAHAALTEPATKESLQKYFEVANSSAIATRGVNAAQAQQWQEEKNPAVKAKKKAQVTRLNAVVRKNATWKTLEPIAVDSFQRNLQEADVVALIAYGESPSGQARFDKLTPAMLNGQAQSLAYMNKRIAQISKQEAGAAFPKPADGSKEALAYTLVLEMPGAREEFNIRMTAVEESMLKDANLAAVATKVQNELTYEEIAAQQAKSIAASLSEAELKMLIEDQRKPELRRLIAMQQMADRDLMEHTNQYVGEKLLPSLMADSKKKTVKN